MKPGLSSFDLSGRVAMITGGNGGLGKSMALAMARAGASIAVLGRNESKNNNVLNELRAIGAKSIAVQIDISQRDELAATVLAVEKELGCIDILVNNAGTHDDEAGVGFSDAMQRWDVIIETNLTAVYALSRLVAQGMKERRVGKIINMASMMSFFGSARVPAYSASKGGVVQLTKSMAIELAPYNIQVNAIAPGFLHTDMSAPIQGTPLYDEIISRTPSGKFGDPDDLACTAIYLASTASNFVTGVTIPVDGGYCIC